MSEGGASASRGWAGALLLAAAAAAAQQSPPAAPGPVATNVPPAAFPATPIPPPPRTAPQPLNPAAARAPSRPAKAEDGVRWQSLSGPQREVLAPLERDWPNLDSDRKQKWLAIADRYRSLPPPERARISERMGEWARLSPTERGELRLRYQETRQVPAPDRNARWEAYQNLPPEQKRQLADRAAVAPVPSDPAARRRDAGDAKANVVPNPALVQPSRPVAPTVVQATPGATTRPITRPAAPPAHQQSGMPKIAATPEFVNRATLLPNRGPQAAAVAGPPAAPPASAKPAAPPASR